MSASKIAAVLLAIAVFPAMGADDPIMIHESNAQMNAAIAVAKKSLDTFLDTKANPPPGAERFSVKVKFTDNGQVEHMWVMPFRKSGVADFEGILNNEPRFVRGIRRGQQVTFSKDQISDWTYSIGGKMLGNFTTCVLTRDGSPESRKYRADVGLQCKE